MTPGEVIAAVPGTLGEAIVAPPTTGSEHTS